MFESMSQLIQTGDSYLFLFPIYTLLIGTDFLYSLKVKAPWNLKDTRVNILITGITLGINLIVGHLIPLALMEWIYTHCALLTLGNSALGWIAVFLLYDLAWYIDHRIGHRTGFFWAMHQVHHSSESYNMTVASRGFLLDISLLNRPTFYLLPLLGVSSFQFICISIATNIWGIAQHTRHIKSLSFLDYIFATPSNHRVHHGKDPKYIDKNYGEVLIVWDILFGTFQREEEEPQYGVIKAIDSHRLRDVQLVGFRRLFRKIEQAKGLKSKVMILVKPPEWRARE